MVYPLLSIPGTSWLQQGGPRCPKGRFLMDFGSHLGSLGEPFGDLGGPYGGLSEPWMVSFRSFLFHLILDGFLVATCCQNCLKRDARTQHNVAKT